MKLKFCVKLIKKIKLDKSYIKFVSLTKKYYFLEKKTNYTYDFVPVYLQANDSSGVVLTMKLNLKSYQYSPPEFLKPVSVKLNYLFIKRYLS